MGAYGYHQSEDELVSSSSGMWLPEHSSSRSPAFPRPPHSAVVFRYSRLRAAQKQEAVLAPGELGGRCGCRHQLTNKEGMWEARQDSDGHLVPGEGQTWSPGRGLGGRSL